MYGLRESVLTEKSVGAELLLVVKMDSLLPCACHFRGEFRQFGQPQGIAPTEYRT